LDNLKVGAIGKTKRVTQNVTRFVGGAGVLRLFGYANAIPRPPTNGPRS
jgi:hypothetical protein